MCALLIPRDFWLAGSMRVLVLNAIVGGMLGGIVLIIKIGNVLIELIKRFFHLWTQCPKV